MANDLQGSICLCLLPGSGATDLLICPDFHTGARDLRPGSHIWAAGTLATKPSPEHEWWSTLWNPCIYTWPQMRFSVSYARACRWGSKCEAHLVAMPTFYSDLWITHIPIAPPFCSQLVVTFMMLGARAFLGSQSPLYPKATSCQFKWPHSY